MTERIKFIELEGIQLKPGSKYIVCLNPRHNSPGTFVRVIGSLDRLIGSDNYSLLPIAKNDLQIYEVLPEEKKS